jgi:predicted NUDIX family NTP pyrophosphohydrolase
MEWPPSSGQNAEFPEVDRVGFFTLDEAKSRINLAQAPFLDRLTQLVLCHRSEYGSAANPNI